MREGVNVSERTSAILGFVTPERSILAHAIEGLWTARADAERVAVRVCKSLTVVACAEGGETADPARRTAPLTGG